MCGYCIEGAVVLDFVANENSATKQEMENNWVSIYLQESAHFPEIIKKLKEFDNFDGSIDVAFCRLWEKLINEEYTGMYQCLVNEYGAKAINDYLVVLKNNCRDENLKSLGDIELYINRDYWDKFLSNINQLIKCSESTLGSYINFWIHGENKKTSDPETRIKETGIMDPIEDTTPSDWGRFYSSFPALYFSFLILKKYSRDSEILKIIALKSPHDVPDLLGYDLWLQRKAFTECVKEYGVEFILNSYDDIRLELIYYSLLKEFYCMANLDALKSHLLSHEHWVNGIDSDSVIELINNLVSIG